MITPPGEYVLIKIVHYTILLLEILFKIIDIFRYFYMIIYIILEI